MATKSCLQILLFMIGSMHGEVIYRDTISEGQNIECDSFPCVINCNAVSSCSNSIISCPKSRNTDSTESVCIINLFSDYSGYQTAISTQQSTYIHINVYGDHSLFNSTINADNDLESHLEIGVLGSSALQYTTIYAPYGEGSALTIVCGDYNNNDGYNCAHMKIYDHFSTAVTLEAFSNHAFFQTEIHRNDVSPNVAYRGSINLYASAASHGFHNFVYYGTDHGDWNIESHGSNAFMNAILYADHSFHTDDAHSILVNGSTQSNAISNLTLFAAQNNVIISLIAMADSVFGAGFELICDGEASFVIDALVMVAMSAHAFENSVINITNDIRNVDGLSGSTILLGSVRNDAIFYVCDDIIDIHIDRVDGNIQFINVNGTGGGFIESQITINDGVGGNVLFTDASNGESFKNTNITILGGIGGNMEMYDRSASGSSFQKVSITVTGIIEGFATWSAGGDSSFAASNITIGSVNHDVLFVSNTFGAFKQSIINIERINGSAQFIAASGSDSAFDDVYIYIEHCEHIGFESNASTNAFTSSHIIFGDVNIVEVSIHNASNALNSSTWDCTSCSQFILNCHNANCATVDIFCPKDNQRDKCKIQCSQDALCHDMEIFTSNGYCMDVKLICDECTWSTFTSTKIYCMVNTLHYYGIKTPSFCQMNYSNYSWICENNIFGGADSFCVNLCTQEPTTEPTYNPTYNPTQVPKEAQSSSDHLYIANSLVKTLIIVVAVLMALSLVVCIWYAYRHYKKEDHTRTSLSTSQIMMVGQVKRIMKKGNMQSDSDNYKGEANDDSVEDKSIEKMYAKVPRIQSVDGAEVADFITPAPPPRLNRNKTPGDDDQRSRKLTDYLIENSKGLPPENKQGLPPPPVDVNGENNDDIDQNVEGDARPVDEVMGGEDDDEDTGQIKEGDVGTLRDHFNKIDSK